MKARYSKRFITHEREREKEKLYKMITKMKTLNTNIINYSNKI